MNNVSMAPDRAALALAPQPISIEVLLERYAQPGERCAEDVQRRIAQALAQVEPAAQREHWAQRFLEVQRAGFVPGGRVCAAAGASPPATMINCFVQPVGDRDVAPEGGHPGILTALDEASETLRSGGGVGYDFSRIRPRGARPATTGPVAPGPVGCIHAFDHACATMDAPRMRRCAQMAVLRIDHPDIETFIHAKDHGALEGFNLSVAVTDAFMSALQADADVELAHPVEPAPGRANAAADRREDGQWVYRRASARQLWQQVMRGAYEHGEPGVLFIDTIQRDNNLGGCETIAATNPCGEQPLPPYGGCCLGSIDLTRFVREPFSPAARFDSAAFAALIPVAVRLLDNVIDTTFWPLPQQRTEALRKRRIGLGFTGLGDTLVMLGLRYDRWPARRWAARMARTLRDVAYRASVQLAIERGAYPVFDAESVLSAPRFASRLPAALTEAVRRHGLRNSHLLSIAPAGTISLAFCDNVSSGIEPAFAWTSTRRRRRPDGSLQATTVHDHAWRVFRELHGPIAPLPPAFVTATQISPRAHVSMAAAVAPFIDTSISKTVNLALGRPFSRCQDVYRHAWSAGLKGLTLFRAGARADAVLSAGEAPQDRCACPRA